MAADTQRSGMESVNRRPRWRRKSQMKPWSRRHSVRAQLQAKQILAVDQTIADGGFILEYTPETQGSKGGVVERACMCEIADA